ncbi:MAG: hypothetical protein MZV64_19400 [Ignavibacteriales bacterium]|nr:hypothetical protein [Ignavibacteriales bacterium]
MDDSLPETPDRRQHTPAPDPCQPRDQRHQIHRPGRSPRAAVPPPRFQEMGHRVSPIQGAASRKRNCPTFSKPSARWKAPLHAPRAASGWDLPLSNNLST